MQNIDKTTYQLLSNPQKLGSLRDRGEPSRDKQYRHDVRFYRKRIMQVTRDLCSGNSKHNDLEKTFKAFATECIETFKMEDTNDILQSDYLVLNDEPNSDVVYHQSNGIDRDTNLKTNILTANTELLAVQGTRVPSIESFVIHKSRPETKNTFPIAKEINLSAPSLRDKGVKKSIKKRTVTFDI